jgi:hypothetical protein
MSGGKACTNQDHRTRWVVLVRKANYSAFNGGRRTVSDYSELHCRQCGAVWRTKAAYVDELPDNERVTRIPLSECTGEGLARALRRNRGQRR